MKSCPRGRRAIYWYAADIVAIVVAIAWPGWVLSMLTWLVLVAMLVGAGRIPVHQRS